MTFEMIEIETNNDLHPTYMGIPAEMKNEY